MPKPSIKQCAEAAGMAFDVPAQALLRKGRCHFVAHPRQAAFWLARLYGYSYKHIGYRFGMDHSTVVHGKKAADRRAEEIEDYGDRLCKAYMSLMDVAQPQDVR